MRETGAHSIYAEVRGLLGPPRRAVGETSRMIPRRVAQYEIQRKIGAGGHGSVYLARDRRLGRPAALKLTRSGSLDPQSKKRFLREARCAGAITHPNIAILYEIGSHQGADFMAMEYVPSRTLDHLIPKGGLPFDRWCDLAIQMASAVSALHAAGIVHRDLKPANFAVTKGGTVKLLDFGIAKPLHATRFSPLTQERTIKGTAAYMSPEQASASRMDARTDVFSLGSVFYEMLTGHRAFARPSYIETMHAILHDAPTPIRRTLPQNALGILERCLKKNSRERFPNARRLVDALRKLPGPTPA